MYNMFHDIVSRLFEKNEDIFFQKAFVKFVHDESWKYNNIGQFSWELK